MKALKFCARSMMAWAPNLLVRLYRGIIAILIYTCRCKIEGLSTFLEVAKSKKCALVLWHDNLAIAAALLKKYAPDLRYLAVVSNSRDGQMLGKLAASYTQCETLYVPHDAKEIALKRIVTSLNQGERVLILTPDGPRGPKHQLKPGIAMAAVHTGATIIPMSWCSNRSWKLKTWDKMAFPKPFSSINIEFGPICAFNDDEGVEKVSAILEMAMKNRG